MDILADSRLAFRQGLNTVQPFAMVISGKLVCRYQHVSKERQTRGHSVRIVWYFEAQKKYAFVSVVSVQAKPLQKVQKCRPYLGGEGRAVQHHMRHSFSVSATQSITIDTWCRFLYALTGACAHTDARCHGTYCIPGKAIRHPGFVVR